MNNKQIFSVSTCNFIYLYKWGVGGWVGSIPCNFNLTIEILIFSSISFLLQKMYGTNSMIFQILNLRKMSSANKNCSPNGTCLYLLEIDLSQCSYLSFYFSVRILLRHTRIQVQLLVASFSFSAKKIIQLGPPPHPRAKFQNPRIARLVALFIYIQNSK